MCGLLSALLFLATASLAQLATFGGLAGSSSLPPDSLGSPRDSLAALHDSLGPSLDSLGRASTDSLAAGADSLGFWRRLLRRPAVWPSPAAFHSPDERPLPAPASLPDRPAEDFADVLLPLAAGPLYDQAEVGHRQLLALDGLKPGLSALRLDGHDLSSRITGLSDLNLVAPGLTVAQQNRHWERLGERPGGALELVAERALSDSVLTRVRWEDGFMGFVSTEGEFARSLLGGRALLASRQTWTGERAPGSHYRGNLVQWAWDRPLGGKSWLLRLDQRQVRDASEVLDHAGFTRRLRQDLLRGRLSRLLSDSSSLGLDVWRRLDRESTRSLVKTNDRQHLKGAALVMEHSTAGQAWVLRAGVEDQRLGRDEDWELSRLESRLEARGAWTRPIAPGRLTLEPTTQVWRITGDNLTGWSAGGRLGLTRLDGWGDLLLSAGALPPTPEQLHLERLPTTLDAFTNPWLREARWPLEPNARLARCSWERQELRLGTTLWGGRAPVSLRVWRVDLKEDPTEIPISDSTWSWGGFDHTQWGAQLFLEAPLRPGWRLRLAQGWFGDGRNVVSREYPSYLLDGALVHERRLFRGDLDLRVTAGLHHEYGGVGPGGVSLWERPEIWLMGEATRKRFTLWWSLRNPYNLAANSRVAGRPLHGHEEWLGVRWGFID